MAHLHPEVDSFLNSKTFVLRCVMAGYLAAEISREQFV